MFFQGWSHLIRAAVMALCAYTLLLFLLRLSGKHALSRMNAFDLVINVAIGSMLATVILSKSTDLAQAGVGFLALILIQMLVNFLSLKFHWIRKLVISDPTLLVYEGHVLPAVLREHRLTRSQLNEVLRSSGISSLEEAAAMVLESNGTISVLKKLSGDDRSSTLEGVRAPSSNVSPRASSASE